MSSSEQPPSAPASVSAATKKNPRYPTKKCKFFGVTFRASRDKYQARIYKGNKEYNLGLFDLGVDAALTYDAAHRLVKHISASHGREREALERFKADNGAPHWLDFTPAEAEAANAGLDPEKLNFLQPEKYRAAREEEMKEPRIADTSKTHGCPTLDEAKLMARKEAIRVCRIIVGAIDGGSNNSRRKGKKNKRTGEDKGGSKKKGKSANSYALMPEIGDNRLASDLALRSAWMVARDDAYFEAPGLVVPGLNPSRTRLDHPFGLAPLAPLSSMGMLDQELMRRMGNRSALGSMVGDLPAAPDRVDDLVSKLVGDKGAGSEREDAKEEKPRVDEKGTSGNGDGAAPFLQGSLMLGNIGGTNAGINPVNYAAAQSRGIYSDEYFSNMSGALANERMMLAQSMGTGAGMETSGSMLGLTGGLGDNGASLSLLRARTASGGNLNPIGVYGGALQGARYGLNAYSYGQGASSYAGEQQTLLPGHSAYSMAPQYNGFASVGGYNPAFHDPTQMLGLPGASHATKAQNDNNI